MYMRNGQVVTASRSRGTTGNSRWGPCSVAESFAVSATLLAPMIDTKELFKKLRRDRFFNSPSPSVESVHHSVTARMTVALR